MNHPSDHDHLLTDVLADVAPAGFRAALLDETLGRVRRQRRFQRMRRRLAVVAAAGAVAGGAWWSAARRQAGPADGIAQAVVAAPAGYQIIRTQPLPVSAVVGTQPFGSERLVASVPNVALVHTTTDVEMKILNDNELLALAGARPATLVRVGPSAQELIFADPQDRIWRPLN